MAGIGLLPPVADGVENHPLLNPVVLRRLFELIPFELKEFKNFRLVSRTWNNLSLSKWRENAWLALVDSDSRRTVYCKTHEISVCKYRKLMKNDKYQLAKHPFRKYVMTKWDINLQEDQEQLTFWNRMGPLMRHLILQKCKFFEASDVRTVIFEKTPNLQRLSLLMNIYQGRIKRPDKKNKRLDLNLPQNALIPTERVQTNFKEMDIDLIIRSETDVYDIVETQIPPITWLELLMYFPNIKKLGPLQLGTCSISERELEEFFESVEVLRQEHGSRCLAELQDLDLMQFSSLAPSACSGWIVSWITRLQYPLKRLTLAMGPFFDETTFKNLLQGCVNTLEYLSVARVEGFRREGPAPFHNFPFGLKFLALKVLILGGPVAPNLMFLKECPNLERLRLFPFFRDKLKLDFTQLVEESDGKPPKLEKLKEVWITNDGCNAEEVMKLGQLMPNVKSLRIGLDNGGFRAVCGVWKELEHLVIDPWQIEERALLGKDEDSGENFHYPNLMNLKNLKWFKMEGIEIPRDPRRLTNAAVLEGFMALQNLEMVKLLLFISGHSRSSRADWEAVSAMLRQ